MVILMQQIRPATPHDAPALADLYNHYIRHSIITFEEEPVSAQAMAIRLKKVQQEQGLPWLVAEHQGQLLGYSYASQWKERQAYRYTVEGTLYLQPTAQGQGLGSRLYQQLLEQLQALGKRQFIGVIALPNDASVALHEKLGMVKVAHFHQVGFKFERWIDVGYWQKAL